MTVTSGSPVAHTVYNGATCAATPEPSRALGLVNMPTLTCGVGYRRQIPGTQKSREPIPLLQEDLEAGHPDDPAPAKGGGQEPTWMKLSVTAPARESSKVDPCFHGRLTDCCEQRRGARC